MRTSGWPKPSLAGVLIQGDPDAQRPPGCTAQRKGHVRTRRSGHLQAEERGRGKAQTCRHLHPGFQTAGHTRLSFLPPCAGLCHGHQVKVGGSGSTVERTHTVSDGARRTYNSVAGDTSDRSEGSPSGWLGFRWNQTHDRICNEGFLGAALRLKCMVAVTTISRPATLAVRATVTS